MKKKKDEKKIVQQHKSKTHCTNSNDILNSFLLFLPLLIFIIIIIFFSCRKHHFDKMLWCEMMGRKSVTDYLWLVILTANKDSFSDSSDKQMSSSCSVCEKTSPLNTALMHHMHSLFFLIITTLNQTKFITFSALFIGLWCFILKSCWNSAWVLIQPVFPSK